MNTPTPPACAAGHDGEMHPSCTALTWLFEEAQRREFKPRQVAVLAMLLASQSAGHVSITKLQIGALVGLSERQVAEALREIADIIETRRGGRNGNRYVVRDGSTGSQPPEVERRLSNITSGLPPVIKHNQRPTTGSQPPVTDHNQRPAAVEILPPIRTRTRAETPINITTTTQLYPERPESSGESVTQRALTTVAVPERLSGPMTETMPYTDGMREFAANMGFVNGTGESLFEQFRDHQLSKNGISANWAASWRKWVRDEIKYRGAPNAERSHSSYDVRRPKVSASTAILLQQMRGGSDID